MRGSVFQAGAFARPMDHQRHAGLITTEVAAMAPKYLILVGKLFTVIAGNHQDGVVPLALVYQALTNLTNQTIEIVERIGVLIKIGRGVGRIVCLGDGKTFSRQERQVHVRRRPVGEV